MKAKEKIWLVLDEKKVITGPFSKEEILELFKQKKIRQGFHLTNNELSWFSVQEREYLLSFFSEVRDIERKQKEKERHAKEKKELENKAKNKTSTEKPTEEEVTQQINTKEFQVSKTSIIDKAKQVLAKLPKIPKPTKFLTKAKNLMAKSELKKVEPKKINFSKFKSFLVDAKLIILNKKVLYPALIIVIASILIILGIAFFSKKVGEVSVKDEGTLNAADYKETIKNIKMSFILKDIQKARRNIAAIRRSSAIAVPLSITMTHKELLFDINEAVKQFKEIDLKKIKKKEKLAEIYNIFSIYHLSLNKEKALKWAKEATKAMPNIAVYELNLVNALLENGKKEEAKTLLNKVIASLSNNNTIEEYSHMLMASLNEGNPVKHYKRALELNPSNGEAILLLALEYGKNPKTKGSEKELLEKFINLLPASTDNRIKNFRLVPLESKYVEIRNKIRERIARKRDPLLLAIDGILSVKLEEFLQAKKSFQESLKVGKANIYAVIGIAYQNLMEGKADEVYVTLMDEEKKYKNIFAIKALIGISHLREKKFPLAGKYLKPLLNSHKHLSQPWSWMAQVNLGLNNREEAFLQLQKSIKIDPYNSIAVRSLISAKRLDLLNTTAIDKIFPF